MKQGQGPSADEPGRGSVSKVCDNSPVSSSTGTVSQAPPEALGGWQPLKHLWLHTNMAESESPVLKCQQCLQEDEARPWVLDTAFQVQPGDHIHERLRQENCCEIKATLGYTSSRSARVRVRYVEKKTKT